MICVGAPIGVTGSDAIAPEPVEGDRVRIAVGGHGHELGRLSVREGLPRAVIREVRGGHQFAANGDARDDSHAQELGWDLDAGEARVGPSRVTVEAVRAFGSLGGIGELAVESVDEARPEEGHAHRSDGDARDREECDDAEDESSPQGPDPVHTAALMRYPTPRTVWIMGGPTESIFLRR